LGFGEVVGCSGWKLILLGVSVEGGGEGGAGGSALAAVEELDAAIRGERHGFAARFFQEFEEALVQAGDDFLVFGAVDEVVGFLWIGFEIVELIEVPDAVVAKDSSFERGKGRRFREDAAQRIFSVWSVWSVVEKSWRLAVSIFGGELCGGRDAGKRELAGVFIRCSFRRCTNRSRGFLSRPLSRRCGCRCSRVAGSWGRWRTSM